MINQLLSRVPTYDQFISVDELTARSQELAFKNPGIVRLEIIGESTDGEDIRMLRIGQGKEQLLFIGCPHPNEPIGMLTIDFLAQQLVENARLRGDQFTWNLILCTDPDATRLNEGWFQGPYSLSNYTRDFYRPPFGDQAILAFPFVYHNNVFLQPIAETQALMTAITALQPRFIASLHNAALGGGYYYLSPYIRSLADPFRQLLSEREIPLAEGEPELIWGVEHSSAIFGCAAMRDHYDFLLQSGESDSADKLHAGETTYGFAREICDPLFLICEVPYFADPRIGDCHLTPNLRRDSILQGIDRVQEILSFTAGVLDDMSEHWATENRFRHAVETIVPGAIRNEAARKQWVADTASLDAPATVAQDFSNRLETPFYHVLNVGTLGRALQAECAANPTQVAVAALAETEAQLARWLHDFEKQINYQIIPIKSLVEVQLASALLAIESL
jgi:Zinc carboxypeptidase